MIPSFWRKIKYRYDLIGTHCKKCGRYYYPPRNLCPRCRRKGEIEEVKLPEKGKVLSYTVVYERCPVVIALIELENGTKILSQLSCKPEEVKDGMEVVRVFRKYGETSDDGIIYYGTKFVPCY
ncbi:MAG: Zn-ribbon domain-containing OB-fold protein [Archaeoglobaceae archaeon]|nr:Zn-ribbon domain-containing OB-fold protein [Archaeoglobaceae archaeon]MCX8152014.1 Zn-ribbon domain-containing OB-fold protein [Archaeoglobaceae archaeon]MDW8013403.1 Zn-ribbon domain-containing OB-fold protein [Archaeoglobaceae archaeon]